MDVKLILHPTDGSESAAKALDFACDLAASKKAALLVLYVQTRKGGDQIPEELAEYSRVESIRETEAELLLAAALRVAANAEQKARERGISAIESMTVVGDPARQIVTTATERNADTIVMGSRGLGDLQGLLLGSVSHKVASAAPCTCIVVR